jgi:hypothetical protein
MVMKKTFFLLTRSPGKGVIFNVKSGARLFSPAVGNIMHIILIKKFMQQLSADMRKVPRYCISKRRLAIRKVFPGKCLTTLIVKKFSCEPAD